MNTITLRAEPITSAGFAPFGQVIGADELEIGAYEDETLHLDILSKEWEPIHITSFNRHFKATQAQVALNGKPIVVVVGPGGLDLSSAEHLEQFRAFICDGSVGFNLALRTWHNGAHPMMGRVDLLNLQGRSPAVDIEIVDIQERFGVDIDLKL